MLVRIGMYRRKDFKLLYDEIVEVDKLSEVCDMLDELYSLMNEDEIEYYHFKYSRIEVKTLSDAERKFLAEK